jgi:N-[(2S)-2-amino-2-carboxyethyl]-L-glutamate dehydrogenase
VFTEDTLFLNRGAVLACLAQIDPLQVTAKVLHDQAVGRAEIPAEGYLAWDNSEGAYTRAIAMLGALHRPGGPVFGMKLINASISNPAKGLERAGGLSFLFDQETARPRLIAEAGYLSAVRTAAYTMVSLKFLGPQEWDAVSLIGAGTLARAHVDLLSVAFPDADRVTVSDLSAERVTGFTQWAARSHPRLKVKAVGSVREALAASSVTVTVTTSNEPYIPAEWIQPGSFLAHVSLADLTEEVFLGAQAIYGDDLDLIADNPRRILGRLLKEGAVTLPGTVGAPATGPGRVITGTLGQVLLGTAKAIRPGSGYVVSNPFGMSILDIGLIDAVYRAAVEQGIGQRLNLL